MTGYGTATLATGLIRSTMADLINELRTMSEAGTGDYSLGTITFWTDAQLQAVLDKKQSEVDYEQMNIFSKRVGSITEYKEYYSGHTNWEDTPTVRDTYGSALSGTLYTFDPVQGEVEFTADQYGSARFISGYFYDLNGAAGEVWHKKMGNAAKMYDFSTDRHSMSRSQFMAHCKEMYQFYQGQAGPNVIQVYREDTRPPIYETGDE